MIVYLAVCLLTTPVQQCNRATAIDWFVAGEVQHDLAACMIHGQTVAARRSGDLLLAHVHDGCLAGGAGYSKPMEN